MPITQDRMLLLIKAGEAYRDAYQELQAFLKECVRALDKGEDDGATLLREVEMQMNLLRPNPERVLPLHAEADHFKRTYKLNQKEKMRQATRRYQTTETLDYRPKTTAPRAKPEGPVRRPVETSEGTARIGDHFIQLDPTSMAEPPRPDQDLFGPEPQAAPSEQQRKEKPPKPDWCHSQAEWDEYLESAGGPPELEPQK